MYRLFLSNEGICDLFCYSKVRLIFHIGEIAFYELRHYRKKFVMKDI